MTTWWRKGVAFPIKNENFLQILNFFLLNCPVVFPKSRRKVSQRAKSLEKIGWTAHKLLTLLANMKSSATKTLKNNYFKSDKADFNVEETMSKCEQSSSYNDKHFEVMVFVVNSELGETRTIFYYIRNAFAHGAFSVCEDDKNPVYYLESAKDGKIKGQFRLKETTLLEWIRLSTSTPDKLKMRTKKSKNKKKAIKL